MVFLLVGESSFIEYVVVEGGVEEDKGLGEEVRLVVGIRFWVWFVNVICFVCV